MLEFKRKEFDNTIYPRFYYQLLTMPLVYKARSVRELSYKNLLIWRYSSQKAFGFGFFFRRGHLCSPKKKSPSSQILTLDVLKYLRLPSPENSPFSLLQICVLVQEILLAFEPIVPDSFEFPR